MRKRTIVLLIVFLIALGCIVGFEYVKVPQGCFTLLLIISGVGLCIDLLMKEGK